LPIRQNVNFTICLIRQNDTHSALRYREICGVDDLIT
jgi:hypothetical protein